MYQAAKGQTTSIEFMMVSGVVALIVVASFAFYDLSARRTDEAKNRLEMEILANDIMDGLVRTNGIPGGWEDYPSSVTSFGIANDPLVLSPGKVSAFASYDYQSAKQVLGIGAYDYRFNVRTINNTVVITSGQGPTNPKVIVNPKRTAVMNGTVFYVDFMLWR